MKLRKNRHQFAACENQAGFTLIEVLVTGLLLTIGLLGTAGLTAGIIKGNYLSKNISAATAIAKTQLEAIQNVGYAGATTTAFPSTAQSFTMGGVGVTFSRTTTIAINTPAANMKQVTILVQWNEANNTARSVKLQTILSQ